ncbi:MAG: lytic murein transglycosylase, partial [Thermodesulfobacteriota bacterium]
MQFYPKLNFRPLLVSAMLTALIIFNISPSETAFGQPLDGFSSLQQRLVKEGFSKSAIEIIYENPLVQLDIQTVLLLFKHREGKLDYGQFTTEKSIQKAKKYMEDHRSALEDAQKKYGVDPRVITAIL